MKKVETPASCGECGEPLKRVCPACGRRILVVDGKLKGHEAGTVHNTHMTWGVCSGSGKGVP